MQGPELHHTDDVLSSKTKKLAERGCFICLLQSTMWIFKCYTQIGTILASFRSDCWLWSGYSLTLEYSMLC